MRGAGQDRGSAGERSRPWPLPRMRQRRLSAARAWLLACVPRATRRERRWRRAGWPSSPPSLRRPPMPPMPPCLQRGGGAERGGAQVQPRLQGGAVAGIPPVPPRLAGERLPSWSRAWWGGLEGPCGPAAWMSLCLPRPHAVLWPAGGAAAVRGGCMAARLPSSAAAVGALHNPRVAGTLHRCPISHLLPLRYTCLTCLEPASHLAPPPNCLLHPTAPPARRTRSCCCWRESKSTGWATGPRWRVRTAAMLLPLPCFAVHALLAAGGRAWRLMGRRRCGGAAEPSLASPAPAACRPPRPSPHPPRCARARGQEPGGGAGPLPADLHRARGRAGAQA